MFGIRKSRDYLYGFWLCEGLIIKLLGKTKDGQELIGLYIQITKSYLKNRKQYRVTNGVESYIGDVKCGVPQGSVLSPLLFSLYINDIYRAVGQDCIRLFEDDTALFMYNENLISLTANVESKFNELYLWCVRNKLTINCDKASSYYSMRQTSQYRNKWMKLSQVIWLSKESNHLIICVWL